MNNCPEKGQLARCVHCGKRWHQIKECRSKLNSETSGNDGKSTTSSVKGKGKEKGKGKDKGKYKGKGKRMGMIEENDQENTESEFDSAWISEVFMMSDDLENFVNNLVAGLIMFIVDCGAEVHAMPYYLALLYGAKIVESKAIFEALTATRSPDMERR